MLLPFEFLFPRGFFAADILVVFPLTCFLSWNFGLIYELNFWRIFDATFWNATLGILFVKLCTCGLLIELLEIVTERKYFMDWLFFLDLTLGFDFWYYGNLFLCGSRTFAQDFVSSLSQSKARHLESIFGATQDCTWELGSNTLEASCREFVSLIKDFTGGFYWLLNR